MNIVSWNVNGIRACFNKGKFFDFIEAHHPDILFIQETKLQEEQIPPELDNPKDYYSEWHCAQRKGYSSVALFTKPKPLQVFKGIGVAEFDAEGRVIGAEYDTFIAFGIYFPNGQQSSERLDYKLRFYAAFFDYIHQLQEHYKKPVFVSGDYNTAHKEIDLARPKENEDISGFLPIERQWMDRLHDQYGFTDTFRLYNDQPNEYSWWTYRAGARPRNIGWRIDYVLADSEGVKLLNNAYILQDVMGSDHCPVGVELNI